MVMWLYPGLYCAFVWFFIVFVKADRCYKCDALAVHEWVVQHQAQSALAKDVPDRGRAIDWGSAKVVHSHQQYHQRRLLKSWHIRSQNIILSQEEGTFPQYTANLYPGQASGTPSQVLLTERTSWSLHPLSHAIRIMPFFIHFIITI